MKKIRYTAGMAGLISLLVLSQAGAAEKLPSEKWEKVNQVFEAAARRANEDVLVDAHWVGGDPGKGNVYGVAAWNPEKATLLLRNPSDKPQTIDTELRDENLQPQARFIKRGLFTPMVT